MKLLSGTRYLLLVILFLVFCNKNSKEINEYADLMSKHPATEDSNYPQKVGSWTNRVFNIDKDRISYIKEINEIDGFSEIPSETESMQDMKTKIELVSKSFHPNVRAIFDKYIYAIYFCENLGGTGITGFVYDSKTALPVGGFIIIDAGVIKKKANDWISYKENTVFSKTETNLTIKIENEKDNTIENSIRYILLHEMGHIISNVYKITPDFRDRYWEFKHPFFRDVWRPKKISIYDQNLFPLRPKIIFYAEKSKLIDLDKNWDKVYPTLYLTNFPTLYAATNVQDHFAETFVSYIHCIIDGRPWELSISRDDRVIFTMKNRISEMEVEKEFIRKIIFE